MNTFNSTRIVLCLLMFSCMMVFGQASKEDTPKLTRADVEESMSEMSDLIINGYPNKGKSDSKILDAGQLKIYADMYKKFYALPEIEKLTGYSREWYGNLLKIVGELAKCGTDINDAIINVHRDKLEQLKKKYKELQKIYKQTYEKPQKAK